MVLFTSVVSAACLLAPGAVARLLGPMDPAPVDIASGSSVVQAAWKNITAQINTLVGDHGSHGLGNFTFSIGIFSMHDAAAQAAYQYHHTGPDVAQSPVGVASVDGDSMYRVASITKLMTALVGVLRLNASDWNRPLTEIFPETAELPVDDPLKQVQWEQITPLALVSQATGLETNGYPWGLDTPTSGIPTPCTPQQVNCSALDYITGLHQVHLPSFEPWTTPQYGNTNFVLLGLVLTRLTGQRLDALYEEAIFEPLRMARSTLVEPADDEGAFPGYVVAGEVDVLQMASGILRSSGGAYSTTNDLARLGVGILNGTLLGAAETRRWMRPTAFTAAPEFAVGMGWEIYRYAHAAAPGVVTDLYTKMGASGNYTGYEVLVPDYGAGFSLLLASGLPSATETALVGAQARLADLVTAELLPALQQQAAAEAARNFAGTYAAAAEAASLTLVYNATATPGAGLAVASFEVGGADMLHELYRVVLGGEQLVLQPAIHDGQGPARRLSFQATKVVAPSSDGAADVGPFTRMLSSNDWFEIPSRNGKNARTFEFDLGADGKATAVTVPVLELVLERVEE